MTNTFLFLGTGASMGVPVIGCSCPVCLSGDPHNYRLRPSGLLIIGDKKILIDVGTDYRLQALKHRIDRVDGVILTHAHHDHTAGVDELRAYTLGNEKPLPIVFSKETADEMEVRYRYIFSPKNKPQFTAHIKKQILEKDRGVFNLLGLEFSYFSYYQMGMKVTGVRYQNFAYISDIRDYPESIFDDLKGVEILVISALRYAPTKMHFSIDEAVEFSLKVCPKKTFLTHISHELDHQITNSHLPPNIGMSYDGLTFNF